MPESKEIRPFGQIVLSKFPMQNITCLQFQDSCKHHVVAELRVTAGMSLLVASVHLSSDTSKGSTVDRSEQRQHQLQAVVHHVKNRQRQMLFSRSSCAFAVPIIAGDFNMDGQLPLSMPDFVDLWNTLRPHEPCITYDCEGNNLANMVSPRRRSFQPDRILIGRDVRSDNISVEMDRVEIVDTCDGTPLPASDHYGLCGFLTVRRLNFVSPSLRAKPTETKRLSLRTKPSETKRLCVFHLEDILSWATSRRHKSGASFDFFVPGRAHADFKALQTHDNAHLLLLVEKKTHTTNHRLPTVCAHLGIQTNVDDVDFHFYARQEGETRLSVPYLDLIVSSYQRRLHPSTTHVWHPVADATTTRPRTLPLTYSRVDAQAFAAHCHNDVLLGYYSYKGKGRVPLPRGAQGRDAISRVWMALVGPSLVPPVLEEEQQQVVFADPNPKP